MIFVWPLAVAVCAVVLVRWLRVCQREHYLPGSVFLTLVRWLRVYPLDVAVAAVGVGGVVAAVVTSWTVPAVVGLVATGAIPLRLATRGRSSRLVWTKRLRRLAMVVVAVLAVATAALVWIVGSGPGTAAMLPLVVMVATEVGLRLAIPIEIRLSQRFVDDATARLRTVAPSIVAITGSFGKTSTKEYIRHLCDGATAIVASPASFNNRMGLSRAVNEHLAADTAVFVAEMGTYGPGEIRDMCAWVSPTMAVMTAIGPVHLERFRSVDRIVEAKSEILADVEVGFLNVDDERLAALADGYRGSARLVRVSTRPGVGDVRLIDHGDEVELRRGETSLGRVSRGTAFLTNAALAAAVSLELGVDAAHVVDRIGSIPASDHRQSVYVGDAGFTIVDDTFNSNPTGASAALERLASVGAPAGRRVVVTPGMVELGSRQHEENVAFAAKAAAVADDLVIVGRTNRAALLEGAAGGPASVIVMPSRDDAVAWVRSRLGAGDAVLYENDLPDHYP